VDLLRRHHAAAGELNDTGSKQIGNPMAQSKLQDELNRAQYEPLLPIEKKLVGWSLGIGIVLLVGLAVLNHFVPATF
jgi:hypothetical protein